jgi:hypothetical protein
VSVTHGAGEETTRTSKSVEANRPRGTSSARRQCQQQVNTQQLRVFAVALARPVSHSNSFSVHCLFDAFPWFFYIVLTLSPVMLRSDGSWDSFDADMDQSTVNSEVLSMLLH